MVPHFGSAVLGAKRAIETQTLKRNFCASRHAKRGRNATETRERTAVRSPRMKRAKQRNARLGTTRVW
eukprot:11215602-Lingulodinium_polyedra.AAC.1